MNGAQNTVMPVYRLCWYHTAIVYHVFVAFFHDMMESVRTHTRITGRCPFTCVHTLREND